MKYIPPLNALPGDEGNDDRSHWNADPSGSNLPLRQGAYPDARGFEAVQREVVHVIEQAGLTPDSADHTQLHQAMVQLSYKMVGEPFALWDHWPEVILPDNGGTSKFIRLTAGQTGAGQYNNGLLTAESVSGAAPLVQATAQIMVGALAGKSVRLINTEARFLRAAVTSGAVQNDAFQAHRHNANFEAAFAASSGGRAARSQGIGSSGVWDDCVLEPITDGVNGAVRTGNETRPKNISATYYMRIV